MNIRCLFDGQFKLSEGPVWCDRTQSVWWVNMVDPPAVYRLAWGSAEPEIFLAPAPVTGVALTEAGHILLGSIGTLLRLDPVSGLFAPILQLDGDKPGNRCNELGVDPNGNLWVGTMTNNLSGAPVDPSAGALFRVSPDGHQSLVLKGIGIPNTLVWDDMGRLITADSMTGVIRRIQLSDTGEVLAEKVFQGPIDLGVPDGSALSSDGTLWNARWSAGCLLGIGSDGTVGHRIDLPGGNITSACFAGPDLCTLIVTSSRWGLSADALVLQPQSGGIFAIEGIGTGSDGPRFAMDIGTWPIKNLS